jgi:hypothetical protein
LEEARNLAK